MNDTIEGYLDKLGEYFKSWKGRYFTYDIRDNILHYYDDDTKPQCRGCFNMVNATITSFHPNDYQKEYVFGFCMNGADKTTILSCPDLLTKQKWLAALAPDKVFSNSEAPVISGFLLKKGNYLNLWKKRYFELYNYDKEIRYFSDALKSENLGNSFFCPESAIVRYKPETHDRDYVFGITNTVSSKGSPVGDLIVAANNIGEFRSWLSSLVRIAPNTTLLASNTSSNLTVPPEIDSLPKLLSSPAGFESFSNYLKREYAQENLNFYKDVGLYRKYCESLLESSTEQALNAANLIFEKFIARAAPEEINLPSMVRSNIAAKLNIVEEEVKTPSNKDFDKEPPIKFEAPKDLTLKDLLHIYDDAQDEILKLMKTDSYKRYVTSDLYAKFLSEYFASKSSSFKKK